jgi:2-polyprenyl-6-methoxyphenol hydroxylase-like FAD-dependent oxidoreductase
MRMVDAHGREEAHVDLTPVRDALHGRFISIARADLASALFEVSDGIPTHFGVSIIEIEQDAAGPCATFSDGHRERFDLIVGADGLHSEVRAQAFGPASQFEQFLGCYVVAFRVRGYPHFDELTYVSHTVQRRQVARVSLRDGETLVLLVWRPERIVTGDPRGRDEQQAAVRTAFGDMGWETCELLEAMNHSVDFYFDRVSQIHLPRWSVGSVVRLGDAAACPSLLAGEGAGLAMVEGYTLAGELHRARGDISLALATYEHRLRRFVTGIQKSALWFRGFFAPETTLSLTVRNLAIRALALPFLTKSVAHSLRDDLELPAYLEI